MPRDDDQKVREEPNTTVAEMDAFYRSDCPVCTHEVDWVRRHDRRQRIRYVDVAAPDFDAGRDAGMPIDRLQDCVQVRLGSGEVLEGPAAFGQLYQEVAGMDGTQPRDRTPVISPIVKLGYRLVVEWRLQRTLQRVADACVCWRRAG